MYSIIPEFCLLFQNFCCLLCQNIVDIFVSLSRILPSRIFPLHSPEFSLQHFCHFADMVHVFGLSGGTKQASLVANTASFLTQNGFFLFTLTVCNFFQLLCCSILQGFTKSTTNTNYSRILSQNFPFPAK